MNTAPILVAGGRGQIGGALAALDWPAHLRVQAVGREELDIADAGSVAACLARTRPAAVINAAAYTAVDRAETDIEACHRANATGPAVLAAATRRLGIPLLHLSTDYVFDGAKASPYSEDDRTAPLNVYGASKLAGESAVVTANPRSIVLRTAWVISAGPRNFLDTMLRLAAGRRPIRVVADQHGSPTGAVDVAWAIRAIVPKLLVDPDAPAGIYHFVNAGEATWYDLACEIMASARRHGLAHAEIEPIDTSAYPTAARRPANARLSTRKLQRDFGIVPRDWKEAVAAIMDQRAETRR
ncbi:MAG: dTDP-4-dehydrorhamnose reductase [Rhizobiaceae bacterium]|nr:dTDP-4-dehydrorhamnose reductase [Rhizobiaceae bacterium]